MWYVPRLLVLLAVVLPAMAFPAAGAPPPPPPRTAASPPSRRRLRFFNRDIVTFRTTYVGYSPAGRAATGSERIREALAKGDQVPSG